MLITIQMHGYYIWSHDTRNLHDELIFDQRLQNAANYKAQLLLDTGIYAHCVNGYCPNQMVREYGCETGWNDNANNVESILVMSYGEIGTAYETLLRSPPHRVHLLGEGWFQNHNRAAVGYANSGEIHVYIYLTAICKE